MSDVEDAATGPDSLDLVFSVLKEHEKSLNKVARRLEEISDAFLVRKETSARPEVEVETLSVERMSNWNEFRERSSSAVKVL